MLLLLRRAENTACDNMGNWTTIRTR